MPINLVDRKLNCTACSTSYVFTKGEQEFFLKRGFPEPKRCPECRKKAKRERRKNRRHLLQALKAAEAVNVETVAVGNAETAPVKEEKAHVEMEKVETGGLKEEEKKKDTAEVEKKPGGTEKEDLVPAETKGN